MPETADGAEIRTFLFLQGPSSPLFVGIAQALRAKGVRCLRINLNLGDYLLWRGPGVANYRGNIAEWPAYVRRFMEAHRVTDLVLLGEERPYHAAAIGEARALGIGVYVVEMGHLRPDWVTIEREGLSSNSRFPVDPQEILAAAADLPEPDWTRRYTQTFLAEALADLSYWLPTVFGRPFYPGYRRHGLYHPLAEYAGWIQRLALSRHRQRQAEETSDALLVRGAAFFLYPLQLQTDFQLRAHSPFRSQQDAIRAVLRSFAVHADPAAELLLKIHPLDSGLVNWPNYVRKLASELGVSGRIHVIDGGDLAKLIAASRGMVTVNSTAALNGLQAGKPVKVLGETIYRIAKLTDEQPLDRFWQAPVPPDAALLTAFMRLLAVATQVRGNFYSREGARAAAEAIAEKLYSRRVNWPGAYVDPAPRQRPGKIDVP